MFQGKRIYETEQNHQIQCDHSSINMKTLFRGEEINSAVSYRPRHYGNKQVLQTSINQVHEDYSYVHHIGKKWKQVIS